MYHNSTPPQSLNRDSKKRDGLFLFLDRSSLLFYLIIYSKY
nr:MAG TPA: hypothetical protein [Herelleviridae sp.]